MTICNNCGHELSDESVFCNKCGNKITEVANDMVDEVAVTIQENTSIQVGNKKRSKKYILVSLLAFIILVAAGGGEYWYIADQQKKEEALINQYKEDLASSVMRMMSFSIISEEICNQYAKVWDEAIEADYGISVNGKYASDFNEAIVYQREAFKEKDILNDIKDNTAEVDTLMQGLNNPPTEYQNSYDKLVELYGLYTQYAELADYPKGSLLEFNKTRNNLSSEISKLFNQFKILLPNLNEEKVLDYTESVDL